MDNATEPTPFTSTPSTFSNFVATKSKILFILVTLLIVVSLAGFVFIKQPFKNTPPQQIATIPTPTSTEMVFKYGIPGEVYEATSSASKLESLQKTKMVLIKEQKEVYLQKYPGIHLSDLTLVSVKLMEINDLDKSIKISTNEGSGWIKIAKNWSGITVIPNPNSDKYVQKDSINLIKGDWNKLVEALKKANNIRLICSSPTCAESIEGYIYLAKSTL